MGTSEVRNLEALSDSELATLVSARGGLPWLEWRIATALLEARRHRLGGRISAALTSEAKVQRLYDELPAHRRW